MSKAGKIYFVGAGPGDPELITVKGKGLLERADVVVYTGSLLKEKVLCWCVDDVEVHNSASMELGQIVELMAGAWREGKLVVRLHTGDPAFYSALAEQAEILDAEGVPFEVVPGVSAASAAAAALKKELTVPGLCQSVILTRRAGRTPVPEAESLPALASHGATICIFLSAGVIDEVVRELKTSLPEDTPAAVVQRASWADEISITGTLEDIAKKTREAGIKNHAMILVGKALAGAKGARSKLYDSGFKHGYRR